MGNRRNFYKINSAEIATKGGVEVQLVDGTNNKILIQIFNDNKIGYNIAQILITKSDFNSRESFNNASKTLKRLIDLNVIPIVNENDTVANEELKYGDNDTLSALVALAINANKLILLTDIENLYSKDPRNNKDAQPIKEVHNNEL